MKRYSHYLAVSVLGILMRVSFGRFINFGPCLIHWGDDGCPNTNNITFHLFTRKNPIFGENVEANVSKIMNSNFDSGKENKIIIHGYASNMNLTQLINIKNGYVNDYNVWMVNWEDLAAAPCYPFAVYNLDYVAKCVGELVMNITQASKVPMNESIHIVGFSLGAQLAAYVANKVAPYKIPRITGLDPAMPLFVTSNKSRKLDKSDANFVDVVHTAALTEGKLERCGHVDFYMNGGVHQTGCWNGNLLDTTRCNHVRAPTYFSESITSKVGFWGSKCGGFINYLRRKCKYTNPTVLMGEYVDKNARGYYIVKTNSTSPFALGQNTSEINPEEEALENVYTGIITTLYTGNEIPAEINET